MHNVTKVLFIALFFGFTIIAGILITSHSNKTPKLQSSSEIKIYKGGPIEFTYDNGFFQRLENNHTFVIQIKKVIAAPETIVISVWPILRGKPDEKNTGVMTLKGGIAKDAEKFKSLMEALDKNGSFVTAYNSRVVDSVTETLIYIY